MTVTVSIAYLYTCFTAYTLFKWSQDTNFNPNIHVVSPMKKMFSAIGVISSIVFIGLLIIPGSPAFLGIESRIALGAWIVLGIIFYILKRKEFNKIPEEELNYLILGTKKIIANKDV